MGPHRFHHANGKHGRIHFSDLAFIAWMQFPSLSSDCPLLTSILSFIDIICDFGDYFLGVATLVIIFLQLFSQLYAEKSNCPRLLLPAASLAFLQFASTCIQNREFSCIFPKR